MSFIHVLFAAAAPHEKKKKNQAATLTGQVCAVRKGPKQSGIGSTVDDWSGNDGDRVNTIRTLNNIIPLGVACMRVTP